VQRSAAAAAIVAHIEIRSSPGTAKSRRVFRIEPGGLGIVGDGRGRGYHCRAEIAAVKARGVGVFGSRQMASLKVGMARSEVTLLAPTHCAVPVGVGFV